MAGAADHDRAVHRRQTVCRFRPVLKAIVKTFTTTSRPPENVQTNTRLLSSSTPSLGSPCSSFLS
ncbi:unnamed protein product [Amoebophrya sp. A120]|nr:unnamed protein product [Amoebophrya sp. A120]|eukprot:GSA120T00021685001.1